jgi:hypothetical protein
MDSIGSVPTGPRPEPYDPGDLSDEHVDRLVDGSGGPPAWSEVAELLDRARMEAAVEPDDLWVRAHVAAAASAARKANLVPDPTAGRRGRPMRVGAVAAATTTLIATMGFAAADTLPAPIQSVAAHVASLVGVTVPDGRDRAGRPAVPSTTLSPPGSEDRPPAADPTVPAAGPTTAPRPGPDRRDRDRRVGPDRRVSPAAPERDRLGRPSGFRSVPPSRGAPGPPGRLSWPPHRDPLTPFPAPPAVRPWPPAATDPVPAPPLFVPAATPVPGPVPVPVFVPDEPDLVATGRGPVVIVDPAADARVDACARPWPRWTAPVRAVPPPPGWTRPTLPTRPPGC